MGKSKTISERIEETVEHLLSFIIRFCRTTWVIFRHPLTGIQQVAIAEPAERRFVLPLTYLAIGGFAFTLVISSYPFGLLNIVDLIWFDQEIGETVIKRFKEAFTITGLLSAALPVLLCVTAVGALVGFLLSAPEERSTFSALNRYAFGYQAFVFFIPMVCLIFLEVAISTINGPYVEGLLSQSVQEALGLFIIAVCAIIMLSGLFVPILALSYWRYQFLRHRRNAANLVRQVLTPIYAILGFVLITYAASLPSGLAYHFKKPAPKVELEVLGSPNLAIQPAIGDQHQAKGTFTLAIHNKTAEPIVQTLDKLSFLFLEESTNDGEESAPETETWGFDTQEVLQGGQATDMLLVPTGDIQILKVSGTVALDHDTVEQMRLKASGDSAGIRSVFLLGVRFYHDNQAYERNTAIDPGEAVKLLN